MIHTHEIRQHRDGSIDFDFYRTQAIAMRAHAMRDAFVLKATSKFVLVMAVALGLVTVLASAPGQRALDNGGAGAAAKIQIGERMAAQSMFRWPAGPQPESAQMLRDRIETLANSDPQKWWDGYGKSITRGQAAALGELRRQLTQTKAVIAMH